MGDDNICKVCSIAKDKSLLINMPYSLALSIRAALRFYIEECRAGGSKHTPMDPESLKQWEDTSNAFQAELDGAKTKLREERWELLT